jgi:hypothetical protein
MEWKEIHGYKFRYRISEEGTVQRSYDGEWKDITAQLKNNKRAYVRLRKKNGEKQYVAVVNLMDEYFFDGYARKNGLVIVHRSGSRFDCSKNNLIFMTNSECGKTFGRKSGSKPIIISKKGERDTFCKSVREAAKKTGLTLYSLGKILNGELFDPKGRIIKYADRVI